jgi:hypothetical protein
LFGLTLVTFPLYNFLHHHLLSLSLTHTHTWVLSPVGRPLPLRLQSILSPFSSVTLSLTYWIPLSLYQISLISQSLSFTLILVDEYAGSLEEKFDREKERTEKRMADWREKEDEHRITIWQNCPLFKMEMTILPLCWILCFSFV